MTDDEQTDNSEDQRDLPYSDKGEIEAAEADDANVPVCIFLLKMPDRTWRLTASCYQPRKSRVLEGAFDVYSDSRQVLADMVKEHWLPLYRNAVKTLEVMVDSEDGGSLYYWD